MELAQKLGVYAVYNTTLSAVRCCVSIWIGDRLWAGKPLAWGGR